ncbi:ArsR family transcriptional regulator [Cryobacterium cryoconiti]|uniref:ArsR family transcriptional regulator n=1 Tax=Cryobacterium cryoconiti TaxID=1259239 RepID=A0A4Y8JZ89_9MICO|nr:ArsR family transcriptional regulator [Cryobacterium cryoconiti]
MSGISRVAILELLRSSDEPLDVPALAARVGLHPSTVRSHLDRLVAVGLAVESVEARSRPGRPRLLYSAAAPVGEVPDDSYRLLAGVLAGSLAASGNSGVTAATAAGRNWGSELVQRGDARPAADSAAGSAADSGPAAPVDGGTATLRVVEILDEIGFAPKLQVPGPGHTAGTDPAPTVIELHRCPFLDVATENSDVVCSVHRGLMEGALERLHAPAVSVRLEPFARPGVCLAHLTRAVEAS